MPKRGGLAIGRPDPRQKNGPRGSRQWWDHWTMPIPETGCHIWLGSVCKLGYGRLSDYPERGKGTLVHRAAYECFVGSVPSGMVVCHRCDVPSCVNPDHLFLGTQKENLQDMFKKRRARPQGRDWADRKAQILDVLARNPRIRLRDLACEIGLSYSRVRQIVRDEGLPVIMQRGKAA